MKGTKLEKKGRKRLNGKDETKKHKKVESKTKN
jgi:hypothetical protein